MPNTEPDVVPMLTHAQWERVDGRAKRVLGSVQQIADAAFIYVSAREVTKGATGPAVMSAIAQTDAALHDLTLCCGFPCSCTEGCEGLILS